MFHNLKLKTGGLEEKGILLAHESIKTGDQLSVILGTNDLKIELLYISYAI